ncbi:MAG TPA: hypothetical protein VEB59_01220 [Gemmatimonadales bacterium]|nr:hypothetical protein [Gemmatimonadales bacterium]
MHSQVGLALVPLAIVAGSTLLTPVRGGTTRVECPAGGEVVTITASGDPAVRAGQRELLKSTLEKENATVRLGPDVDLDFSDLPAEWFPIRLGRCARLTSVGSTRPDRFPGRDSALAILTADVARSRENTERAASPADRLAERLRVRSAETLEARNPRSRGPVLRFGPHRGERTNTFLEIRCDPDGRIGDGARISGFRLFGPSFGSQTTDDVGIRIFRCVDVEVTNMEIAGWGGAGVRVEDSAGPDRSPEPIDSGGGRLMNPDQVRVYRNYFHHHQHPNADGHAGGYGVLVTHGAWARIAENVFDFNRHSIAASGDVGGYIAERNLVLKGGGYHGGVGNKYTHSFDVHGTGCWWSDNLCGDAGIQFSFEANAFQYRKDNAIKLRGKPALRAYIHHNVFPHPGLENDRGDDAIALQTSENVELGPANVINYDTFGRYGVCDFDGDRVDDLFLATGVTWWYASYGELQWSYLAARTERLEQIRLGYFDDDLRCDVLAERNGQWMVSSGGSGEWKSLGAFAAPLSEVEFGRFDDGAPDRRPGATRRTTHAFRRAPDGQWYVTSLAAPGWSPVQSSSVPKSGLRFGDFTGDGVTDVLAVVGGRWAISESAKGSWRPLNPGLKDPVGPLYIANMDADDNIDDILRLDRRTQKVGPAAERTVLTWWRSRNGVEPWKEWKSYTFNFAYSPDLVPPRVGFAGRFGAAPGGGTLVISPDRMGQFFSPAETPAGAQPAWSSVFAY